MKKIWIVLLVFSHHLFSQQQQDLNKKNVFETLWGESPESSVSFLPVGTHTEIRDGFVRFKDFFDIYYTSYNYKSFELAVFKNSFRDWSIGLMYTREIPVFKKWSIKYGGGIMYGYQGQLVTVDGIPFKKIFFSGPFNPILGGGINYKISEKWSVSILIAPLINAYGIKYHL